MLNTGHVLRNSRIDAVREYEYCTEIIKQDLWSPNYSQYEI